MGGVEVTMDGFFLDNRHKKAAPGNVSLATQVRGTHSGNGHLFPEVLAGSSSLCGTGLRLEAPVDAPAPSLGLAASFLT